MPLTKPMSDNAMLVGITVALASPLIAFLALIALSSMGGAQIAIACIEAGGEWIAKECIR